MPIQNRRKFLREAGTAFTAAATFPNLLYGARLMPGSVNAALGRFRPESISQAAGGPESSTNQKMRGVMVDAARVPEPLEHYRRVVEFCADWQLNALQIRLADDQGTALRFSSVPGLFTHPHAFKPDHLHDLAMFASSHGVDLIPELESFGHTGYITRSSTYAHLLDASESGSSEFTGIIPVNPETLQLFEKLYREIAAIFPSVYLHGGCDEVNWGGSEMSQKALRSKSRSQIWADYLNSLNHLSEELGKQFIVWGDFVIHKEPEILGLLDKKIIVMDWNYSETDSIRVHDTLLKVKANGSRAIGAPALINYQWGPRAGARQLRNIDAFAEAYFDANDTNSLGVILTNWVPCRYVQDSIWDGFAYASVAFSRDVTVAQTSAFRLFVEQHYHAQWNEIWDEAFHLIYDAAPAFNRHAAASSMGLRLPVPWSSDDELLTSLKDRSPRPNPFTRLHSLLVIVGPSVLANLSDFQAFTLSVDYLEGLFWRESVIVEQVARPISQDAAGLLIRNIAERDQNLAMALSKDWDKGRFPDSNAKLHPLYGMEPKDQMLFQWSRAAAYSDSLAHQPDRFYQLLQSAGLA